MSTKENYSPLATKIIRKAKREGLKAKYIRLSDCRTFYRLYDVKWNQLSIYTPAR